MPEIHSYSELLAFIDEHPRRYPHGAVIFSEGQPGVVMYIVRDGQVELRRGGQVVERLGPGEVIGEMALIDPAPRTATAVAAGACSLTIVDEAMFRNIVAKVPGFALELLRVVVRRLRKELAR